MDMKFNSRKSAVVYVWFQKTSLTAINSQLSDTISLLLWSTNAIFSVQNAPEYVWQPGSARTHRGTLSAPPDPLAIIRGKAPREEKGGVGEGSGRGSGDREGRGIDHNEKCFIYAFAL